MNAVLQAMAVAWLGITVELPLWVTISAVVGSSILSFLGYARELRK